MSLIIKDPVGRRKLKRRSIFNIEICDAGVEQVYSIGDLVEEIGYDFGRGSGIVVGFAKEVPHWWRGAYRMGTIHVLWCGSDGDLEMPGGRSTELIWAMPNKIKKMTKTSKEKQNE